VKSNDEFLVDVAPNSDTNVALLCVGNPGMSDADKRVLRSTDTGQTTSPAGTMPVHGLGDDAPGQAPRAARLEG
jgi:hypothetical protein